MNKSNQSINHIVEDSSDSSCSSFQATQFAIPRLAMIVVNILFLYINYRVYSSRCLVYSRQSFILANIACVHILNAMALLVAILSLSQVYESRSACMQLKTALCIITSTFDTCNFINYILFYSNRYISYLFPLTYELVLTKGKVFTAFTLNLMVSLTSGALALLGVLGILGNKDSLQEIFWSVPDSAVYLPVTTYFLCLVTVLGMNMHMWLMGYIAFRKEQATAIAAQNSIAVAVTQENNPTLVRRNHLKTAFVSSVLLIKNLLFLFPLMLSSLMQLNGHRLKQHVQLNMVGLIFHMFSPIFDPFIFIIVVKEARAYFLSMMKRCLDTFRLAFRCIPCMANPTDPTPYCDPRDHRAKVDEGEVERQV